MSPNPSVLTREVYFVEILGVPQKSKHISVLPPVQTRSSVELGFMLNQHVHLKRWSRFKQNLHLWVSTIQLTIYSFHKQCQEPLKKSDTMSQPTSHRRHRGVLSVFSLFQHPPRKYLKAWEEVQHSHDLKLEKNKHDSALTLEFVT